MISQHDLKNLLEYDSESGAFIWKKNRSGSAKKGTVAGSIESWGYRQIKIYGKIYTAHRLAWFYIHNEWPEGEIDHINGSKDDNRIKNLRSVQAAENSKNKKLHKNNKNGLTGVFFNKGKNRWQVSITDNYKQNWLGSYKDYFEACCARKSAELNLGFHPNHGRAA